jgi:hypothetical protein
MKLHRLHAPVGAEGSDLPGGTAGGEGSGSGEGGGEGSGEGSGDNKDEGGEGAGTGGDKQGDGQGSGSGSAPSDADAKLLKDLMKHKNKAKELEAALSQVNEKLKSFEGIDPVKMRELLKQQEEAERKAAESRGEYDRLVKQMGERHAEEKARLEQQLKDMSGMGNTLMQQIADLTVGNSFGTSKFVAEDLTLTATKARVIYGSHFEFKDGQVVGYDKPAGASDRTVLVDAQGEPLAFDEALRKLVEADPDKDQLIRTKAKPGAGSVPAGKTAKKAIDDAAASKQRNLTPAEKIAAGLKALAKG